MVSAKGSNNQDVNARLVLDAWNTLSVEQASSAQIEDSLCDTDHFLVLPAWIRQRVQGLGGDNAEREAAIGQSISGIGRLSRCIKCYLAMPESMRRSTRWGRKGGSSAASQGNLGDAETNATAASYGDFGMLHRVPASADRAEISECFIFVTAQSCSSSLSSLRMATCIIGRMFVSRWQIAENS